MSGLTKSVGHYHRAWSIDSTDTESPGIECRCINSPERMTWTDYAAHVAEVTERAVRAQVAADQERAWREGYYTGKRDYAGSVTGGLPISTPNPYAARIAEGEGQ